jgi:hypothetical protein
MLSRLFGQIKEETPKYQVLVSKTGWEIRRYQPRIEAQTTYSQKNSGFWTLANYIFGRSQQVAAKEAIAMTSPVLMEKTPIAMTSPVITEEQQKDRKMAFVMPSKYKNIEDLPVPSDPNVKLVQIPEKIVAVASFSWWVTESSAKSNEETLRQLVKEEAPEVVLSSDPSLVQVAQYNDPFTLPFYRKNEIWIPVEKY